MKKYVIVILCSLFLLMSVLPIEANVDSNSEAVELNLTGTSGEPAGPPEVISDDAKIRYGWDLLIYSGDVSVSAWGTDLDDESIDVDFAGDTTLRAVVAVPDSTVRVLRSDDRGASWSQVGQVTFGSGGASEPHILHGPDSNYHVFCKYVTAEVDIYAQARRSSNDAMISGTNEFLSGTDSVQNYSVCTDRIDNHAYTVFLVYQEGTGNTSSLRLIRTTDQGQSWTAPSTITVTRVHDPEIAYGGGGILYLSYLADMIPEIEPRVRVSLNGGANWSGAIILESDTAAKLRPQIAAACDNSGNAWAIWPRLDVSGPTPIEYGLRWSWSQDSGATWSSANWTNSRGDSNEYFPSIAVNDYYNSSDNVPYVCYVRADSGHNNPYVRNFEWTGATWSTSTSEAEYNTSLTRPVQTFNYPVSTAAAFAYVGENEQDVYFDTWENSGIEEEDVEAEKITCSLECPIIIGTGILKYSIPNAGHVKVSMFNALGQEVATLYEGMQESGENTLTVSANNLPQGVYYILVNTSTGTGSAKVTVLK